MKRIRIGKNSWGHFRMGSYVSLVAIVAAFGVQKVAAWIGCSDAWWVGVVEWAALAIFAGDIFRSLMLLTPRKRWERVMIFGLAAGGGLLLSSLILWLKGRQEIVGSLLLVGLFTLLVSGCGGWWLWQRERRKLNSLILERKLKRKKRSL